jgi:hypothetical protein
LVKSGLLTTVLCLAERAVGKKTLLDKAKLHQIRPHMLNNRVYLVYFLLQYKQSILGTLY